MVGGAGDVARLAVLIDAVTTRATQVPRLMDEVARLGSADVRRAYGDWTSTDTRAWQVELLRHAIEPVQEFAYGSGRSAAISALTIDAMDLLYEGVADAFCIVSSDVTFTRLAMRLHRQGRAVHGFGGRPAPQALVAACDSFVQLDGATADPPPVAAPRPGAPASRAVAPIPQDPAATPQSPPTASRPAPEPSQPAYRPAPQGGVTYDMGKILQRAVEGAGRIESTRGWQ